MTTIRGSVTVKRMNRGWTLTMFLQSTATLVQEIVGNQPGVDWTVSENSPIVYPTVFSSTSGSAITALSNAKWYYDGVQITEADERFELTTYRYAGMYDVPALKIKSNLGLSITEDKMIRCEVTATVNGSEFLDLHGRDSLGQRGGVLGRHHVAEPDGEPPLRRGYGSRLHGGMVPREPLGRRRHAGRSGEPQ